MKNQTKTPQLQAAELFLARQNRQNHPSGTFDKASRWEPDASEHRSCCDSIRTPSRAFPWSLMVHCRTAKHVAHLTGVDESEIKRTARAIIAADAAERESALSVVQPDPDF